MANASAFQGACLQPFLDASLFSQDGGYAAGRLCASIAELPGNPTCCLPCPVTNWTYPDSFNTSSKVAEWLNVAGLVLIVFMLVSYLVLPAQHTRSHYLSVCLIIAVAMINMGFTIPLAVDPDQCYDAITPNDMSSSTECAWSGAFIVAGGLCAGSWIFIRALSMNLQICWDIMPGRKFFVVSQALGWGIPAILFAVTMKVTGVSFRFGSACHVNHASSMADFWGPLIVVSGAAGILQLVTFGYCIHVYLKHLWSDQTQASGSSSTSQALRDSGLPSYDDSVRTQTARAVYQRLKKVLWLQWRGICIVSIVLVDVVFFCTVFVYLDGLQNSVLHNILQIEPWLLCLALHPTDKDACVHLTAGWLVSESTVAAVLILLSLAGIQVFLFLARPSIFPAWWDFFQAKFGRHRQEFVSRDARPNAMRTRSEQDLLRYTHECRHRSTTFDMQKPFSATGVIQLKSLGLDVDGKGLASPTSTVLSSPDEMYRSPLRYSGREGEKWDTPAPPPPRAGGSGTPGHLPPSHMSSSSSTYSSVWEGNPLQSPPTPTVSYNSISLHRQPSDYFDQTQHQQQQRRPYVRQDSMGSVMLQQQQQQQQRQRQYHLQQQQYHQQQQQQQREQQPEQQQQRQHDDNHQQQQPQQQHQEERLYHPPSTSFSAPKVRTQSTRSSNGTLDFDPRDLDSRGPSRSPLAMNPPYELGG